VIGGGGENTTVIVPEYPVPPDTSVVEATGKPLTAVPVAVL